MIFLPFPILLVELFLFLTFVENYGFFPVLGAYILPSFLGFLVLSFQSRAAMFQLQRRMMEGREPGFQALNLAAKFVSGILLIVPLFLSRVLGLLLLLPGSRHLIVLAFHRWLAAKVARGAAGFFTNGRGFQFRTGAFGGPGFRPTDEVPREERDATVIDVTPLEIEHTDKKPRH